PGANFRADKHPTGTGANGQPARQAPNQAAEAGAQPADPVPAGAPVPWAAWLLIVWAAGALVVLAPLLAGLAGVAWLNREGERLTDPLWVSLVQNLCAELGMKRPVTLLRSGAGTMPMTWGLLRPIILLPAGAEDWPAERRRLVLLHELAHVQRRDCL